jgi:hypothetical protein
MQTNLEVNGILSKDYRDSEFVIYEDLTYIFEHNGKLDPTLFWDWFRSPPRKALHPSSQSQERMATELDPILLKLMSEGADPQHPN